jgi:hypothetical protein
MPRYLVKDVLTTGLSQSINLNSVYFLHSLADKLYLMSTTIEKKIKDLEEKATCQVEQGVFLVSVEAPKMTLGVKYEYVEYIKRYGPPCDGKFNETILEELRKELGIEQI